jgi:hypothetical protein
VPLDRAIVEVAPQVLRLPGIPPTRQADQRIAIRAHLTELKRQWTMHDSPYLVDLRSDANKDREA